MCEKKDHAEIGSVERLRHKMPNVYSAAGLPPFPGYQLASDQPLPHRCGARSGQPAQLQTQREIPAMIDRIFSAISQHRSVIQEVIERTAAARMAFATKGPTGEQGRPTLSPMAELLCNAQEQIEACTEELSTLLESLQL